MQSIIQLLPDAIANQIAAGEVVQRPASVVKELLENAIDAGATQIDLLIRDAGKALIQVNDNGSGMSAQDARMAFERHATSKIRKAEDLFQIQSMGFRGEALAAIAAVSQVKMRTRLHSEELGTEIDIEGGEIKRQEASVTPDGSVFQVKNIFYNVPARRNFLKSNPVETRHITNEFIRIALSNTGVGLTFKHNDVTVYQLPANNLKERISAIFGWDFDDKLIYVEEHTGYVRISGYIGKTNVYRKNRGEQFFFVNKRFIKSNYLHHAVASAYQDFIPEKHHPFYCIFLEIDPQHVDINIHPTKTEVKFDDEKTLYVLLQGIVNRGLADMHNAPEFDFDDPSLKHAIYNTTDESKESEDMTVSNFASSSKTDSPNWDRLYAPEEANRQITTKTFQQSNKLLAGDYVRSWDQEVQFVEQFQETYILLQRGDKLYILHQQLAHERILYERFLKAVQNKRSASQQLLFPQSLELSPMDLAIIKESESILANIGFEIKEFGSNSIIIYGTPPEISTSKIKEVFDQIITDVKEIGMTRIQSKLEQEIAKAIAKRSAVTSNQKLSKVELKRIAEDLFNCDVPTHAPNAKPTYKVISAVELEAYFV